MISSLHSCEQDSLRAMTIDCLILSIKRICGTIASTSSPEVKKISRRDDVNVDSIEKLWRHGRLAGGFNCLVIVCKWSWCRWAIFSSKPTRTLFLCRRKSFQTFRCCWTIKGLSCRTSLGFSIELFALRIPNLNEMRENVQKTLPFQNFPLI